MASHCSKKEVKLKNLQSKAHKKYKSYHERSQRITENNIAKSRFQQLNWIARHCQIIWKNLPKDLDLTGTVEDNGFSKLFEIIEMQALRLIREYSLCIDHDKILSASNENRNVIINEYLEAFEKIFGVDENSLIVKIKYYILLEKLPELLSSSIDETFLKPSIDGITSISTDSRQIIAAVISANCNKFMKFLRKSMYLGIRHQGNL